MSIPRFPWRQALLAALAWMLLPTAAAGAEAPPLRQYNIRRDEITVSGISSGAFMAVQFGVAHSAAVRGIAATAGGPYFCAGKSSWWGASVSAAIAHCMQGDPDYGAKPISAADLAASVASARAWAASGRIDDTANLARTTVWLFHGYNDGIVKKPVSDALEAWWLNFVPSGNLFYKDNLRAAHSQVSASCETGNRVCNRCDLTGGNFINACPDQPGGGQLYDAAGAAFRLFYGVQQRADGRQLSGRIETFSQAGLTLRNGKPVAPYKISMADTGYLYVPAACAAGQPCRLHIAFHGCQQNAASVGTAFVEKAGFNEWADANRIVVLYPQTVASVAPPITPLNPMACWDWWGYNDFSFDPVGQYATRDGAQIASVWRMVERLSAAPAGNADPLPPAASLPAPQALRLADLSHRQVALVWQPVPGAAGYRVYRGTPAERIGPLTIAPSIYVDHSVKADSSYRYSVTALDAKGAESPASTVLEARTAAAPPACDPYFSLRQNRPVDSKNRVQTKTCP